MPYSAVTQPCPLPFRKRGTLVSTLAVHSGCGRIHQHGPFSMLGEVAGDGYRTHLGGAAIAGTGHGTDLWAG